MKYSGPPQSGSVGNQTFSRNLGGQYVRARAGRGGAGDAYFGGLVADWQSLTDFQRNLWIQFARSNPTTKGKLGQTIELTGFDWFMRQNMISAAQSVAVLQPEPIIPDSSLRWSTCILTAAAWSGTHIDLTVSFPPGTSGLVSFESSGVVTPGTMSAPGRGKWWKRFWGLSWATTDVPPLTISDSGQWSVVFGTSVSGDRMFVAVRPVKFDFSYAGRQGFRIEKP